MFVGARPHLILAAYSFSSLICFIEVCPGFSIRYSDRIYGISIAAGFAASQFFFYKDIASLFSFLLFSLS
jgi:hypothetical protein